MRTILKRYLGIGAIAAMAAWSAPVQAAWQYTTVEFPGPDVLFSSLWGVNDSGQAVGFAFDVLVQENLIHPFPFVYDIKKGTYTRIPRAFGEEFGTLGLGINNRGAIAAIRFSPPEGADTGVIRSKQGVYTEFVHPGSTFTEARGINDRGLVAGFADDGPLLVAFVYDPASKTFVDFLPSPFTIAHGINNRGDVTGNVLLDAGVACAACPAGSYGFVRRADGTFSFFRVNGAETFGRGINDSGVIAGQIDIATGTKSFVTRIRGLPYEDITIPDANLLVFPGKPVTAAEGINNRGDVVGIYEDDLGRHGFVAQQSPH